ncbi:uncharacterized protein SPPG_09554 [Spizellomyces punctatus DAOM BR117]|uniref:Uncharacterized protein n=1 Tax=Spizellomyces punctatus (strain DAOM BR117) TaxID=645134 RepID=A0A0L0H459_SPIPD|nr:hypothetical protein, variant [Spizellomyces punctatus DAOM BR117]XP_016604027.1 uncharacterized protein SPPG_09554 [Spizellomyces punctatus DAOM BR117]KNC95986.1 hypothetical protein, variant [Spizellomyces punctatus DAOM BR117]KNC95987.1 hypothetical protein SPPG_09554 [Spizellomyces punctatus DAOM BR117]|eukprot:XP_016604026.1 hypothetical protein, variant [Spizellomyces punctatus DAOM BR117]
MEVVKSRQQAAGRHVGGNYARVDLHASDKELGVADEGDDVLMSELDGIEKQNEEFAGHVHGSTFAFLRSIYDRQGFAGFFVGFWLGILVYVPYSIIYFVLYEEFKNLAGGDQGQASLSAGAYIVCSAVAGAVGASATNCLDVPKTAYQVARDSDAHATVGFIEFTIGLWKREGVWGFTRGIGARVAWMVPTIVLQFTLFESVRKSLRGT